MREEFSTAVRIRSATMIAESILVAGKEKQILHHPAAPSDHCIEVISG